VGTDVLEERPASICMAEDGGSMYLRNVGVHQQVHTAPQVKGHNGRAILYSFLFPLLFHSKNQRHCVIFRATNVLW
jgi:hypothetical protein